jgi:hypothetical protein
MADLSSLLTNFLLASFFLDSGANIPRVASIELLAQVTDEGTEYLEDAIMLLGALHLEVRHCGNTVDLSGGSLQRKTLRGNVVDFQTGRHGNCCKIELKTLL